MIYLKISPAIGGISSIHHHTTLERYHMYNPHRVNNTYTAPDGSLTTFSINDPDTESLDALSLLAEKTNNFPSAHFIDAVSAGKVVHPSDK